MLITARNSSFSTTDSACACKKYELLMHVLANAHKGHFDYFCAFRRQHMLLLLYRGHNNTTSIFNLFSTCCLCEKTLSPWYFISFIDQLPLETKDATL